MSVRRLVWVNCDKCGDGTAADADDRTRAEALATARAFEWHHRSDGRDICASCWDRGER